LQSGPNNATKISPEDSSSSGNSTVSIIVFLMAGGCAESTQGLK
jgi:hypothetical protein